MGRAELRFRDATGRGIVLRNVDGVIGLAVDDHDDVLGADGFLAACVPPRQGGRDEQGGKEGGAICTEHGQRGQRRQEASCGAWVQAVQIGEPR
jgi:hypothetical protein